MAAFDNYRVVSGEFEGSAQIDKPWMRMEGIPKNFQHSENREVRTEDLAMQTEACVTEALKRRFSMQLERIRKS